MFVTAILSQNSRCELVALRSTFWKPKMVWSIKRHFVVASVVNITSSETGLEGILLEVAFCFSNLWIRVLT